MKFSVLALAAVVSLAAAQNLSGEPACATSCLISAISVAGCKPTDVACQCGTGQPAIQSAVTPCLESSCNATDLGEAAKVGFALCSIYSASLNSTTSSVPSSSTSTVASTASTPSSTASTSTTVVTAVTTSVPSTTSTGTSTPAPATSSGAANALVAGIGGAVGMLVVVAAL